MRSTLTGSQGGSRLQTDACVSERHLSAVRGGWHASAGGRFVGRAVPVTCRRALSHRPRDNGVRSGVAAIGGFSILEVLVAFVILSLVGTALFRLFSGALTNIAAAEDYSRAVLVADSVLAEAAATLPLREGSQSGTSDDRRISWSSRVAFYTPPQVAPDLEHGSEAMPTRLWQIAAEVTFAGQNGKPRTLTLATIRLGAKDPR